MSEQKANSDMTEVGAGWINTDAKRRKYLSCTLKIGIPAGSRLFMWRNEKKTAENKQPDYRILAPDVEVNQDQQTTIDPAKDYTPNNAAPRTPDDIPF